MNTMRVSKDGSSAKTKLATDNPHRGKYESVTHPLLSDDTMAGYSAKAWYLFSDPNVNAAFETVFLNGRRDPTVERVPAPANTLGLSWQGYIDFGVREQDTNCALKSKGEA